MRNKTTRRRKLASSKLFAITSIISASFRLSKCVNAKATNPTAKLQDRHPRQAYAKKVAGDIDKPFMSSTGCRSEKPLASAKRITLNTNRRFNHVSFLLVLQQPERSENGNARISLKHNPDEGNHQTCQAANHCGNGEVIGYNPTTPKTVLPEQHESNRVNGVTAANQTKTGNVGGKKSGHLFGLSWNKLSFGFGSKSN